MRKIYVRSAPPILERRTVLPNNVFLQLIQNTHGFIRGCFVVIFFIPPSVNNACNYLKKYV